MQIKHKGFTIVEIIIVVTSIAILLTIAFVAVTLIQQDQRNSEREADTLIIAEALEKYYDENGQYPGCAALKIDPAIIRQNTLKDIDPEVFVAPKAPDGQNNSLKCQDLTDTTAGDIYAFVGDGSTACSTGAACSQWILKYRKEGSNEIVSIKSRRTTEVDGDRVADIAATPASVSSIKVTWSAIEGATAYHLQRSLSPAFDTITTTTHYGELTTATSLTANTTYYFRIRPVTPSGLGAWSATAEAKTLQVLAPSSVTTTASISGENARGTVSASCVGSTLTRQIRYKTDDGAWSEWESYTATKVIPASVGSTYTFQGQAQCSGGGVTSAWTIGNEVSVARTVAAPTGLTLAASMSGTSAVAAASSAVCAAGTAVEYQIRYNSSPTTTAGSWSNYSVGATRSVSALQGHKYIFSSQARCVGTSVSSAWSSSVTANVVRPITTTPGAPTLTIALVERVDATFRVKYTRGAVTSCSTVSTDPYFQLTRSIDTSDSWSSVTTWNSSDSFIWEQIGQGYSYAASVQARCVTSHAEGPWGASRSGNYITTIDTPGAATNFSHAVASGRKTRTFSWTNPTCGSGTRPETRFNSYIGTNSTNSGWFDADGTFRVGPSWSSGSSTSWSSERYYTSTITHGVSSQSSTTTIPSGTPVKIKIQQLCVNPVTGRTGSWGSSVTSPSFTT